jgi:hypothetical protein
MLNSQSASGWIPAFLMMVFSGWEITELAMEIRFVQFAGKIHERNGGFSMIFQGKATFHDRFS